MTSFVHISGVLARSLDSTELSSCTPLQLGEVLGESKSLHGGGFPQSQPPKKTGQKLMAFFDLALEFMP